jgi:1-deoxy-D-xylulose-5-phosphate reductoisomerase
MVKRVTILGASGSIGQNTAAVIEARRAAGDEIAVEAITIGANVAAAVDLAARLNPAFIAVADPAAAGPIKAALNGAGIAVGAGASAVLDAAERPADWVMSAIVGAAGVAPTAAAVRRGATVAIANKESVVCAGPLLKALAVRHGATILPVDSEHNAIFQVLSAPERVEQVVLTASGGPFRTWTREAMTAATPDQARAHPNWAMGAKNSIDSATLMNKGLELIEAAYLFDLPSSKLAVLVHPQSIIHSMVTYCDGSTLAQLSAPDMRIPIGYAFAWPDRAACGARGMDLAAIGQLSFEAVDLARFPALRVAREALEAGPGATAALNGANEIAVDAFMAGKIGFLGVAGVVEATLEALAADGAVVIQNSPTSFDEVFAIDAAARVVATQMVAQRSGVLSA